MTELIAQRLRSNGLLTDFESPLDVLRNTVGVQGQMQREAEMNIALRCPSVTAAQLTELYQSRKIVRSWANRWTLHLFTYDDWEMLINARQGETLPAGYYQGQDAIAAEIFPFAADSLSQVKRLKKSELAPLIAEKFPSFDFGGYAYNAIVQRLTQSGVAFVAADSNFRDHELIFAEDFKRTRANDAIARLIPRYLAGFGPASLQDFVKWSGLKITTVRPIWESLDLPKTVSADEKIFANKTIITARFDSILTGYVDKTWLTPADKIPVMWTKNGYLLATIIQDGKLVGTWNMKISGKAISFNIDAWDDYDNFQLTEKFKRIASFLNKKIID